ncbi:MAG: tetratricopeptide repeat protein, partial [Nitrososphaerota archaeon]|nr:tetratricopeptide repeat protein [Nitrososphaerota archaeon]
MSGEERRLAAIMFTDMVGFTALTQSDESQSLAVLERHNRLLRPFFAKFRGREIKTMGDSFLVEFDSALDAVSCAIEVQRFLHDYNISSMDGWKIALRIGVHLGDVVRAGSDILGDAVNIASRLQPLAEPEGVCVSQQIYDQVRNKIAQELVKLETHDLKGVKFAVDIYRVVMPWEESLQKTQPVPLLDPKRIAVLPLVSMSPDPNDEYFADGLTEELITRISFIKGLEVISRTSVMNYKKKEKNALQIGQELKVGTLLEGSVRKAGNRIRVTAQLINSNTEGHLWAESYDRDLDDVFGIQSEIAEKVAGELRIQLLQSEKKTLERKPTENTEAYSIFLRGRELLRAFTEPSVRQALALFERAVDLDPSFARAHVGIAECHQFLVNTGYESFDISLPRVKASLEEALKLDPGLAEAHAALSEMYFNIDDSARAESEAREAVKLNPNLPDPYSVLSEIAGIRGEVEEAVKLIETAYRLDPFSPEYIWRVGDAYAWTGREQEALEHWAKTERLAPAEVFRSMTDHYLSKGDLAKAKELHSKFQRLQPTHPWVTYMGGFIAARAGDKEGALLAIKKLEEANMGPAVYNYVAYVYHALGDLDVYFDFMNRA